ncbi:DUF2625 family protein [Naumannella sp. ID2617S]|nr:DUF2625 family protein [Naumannella sp. ID2617S]
MTDFWTEWRSAALAAGGDVLVMGATDTSASASLHSQGITPDSAIGAFAQHCGAVLVDGGWLRLLGAGVPGLPGLHRANQSPAESPTAPFVVAVDVLAGVFAVNGGSIPDAAPGHVCHWAPDTLAWRDLGLTHTEWAAWVATDGVDDFYTRVRWPGWRQTLSRVRLDQGAHLHPPPFTPEGRDRGRVSVAVIPFIELISVYADTAAQVGGPAYPLDPEAWRR